MTVTRLLALLIVLLASQQVVALDITTLSGTTYKNCQILEVQPDRIRIMHSTGITSIDFNDLPEKLRNRYHYDPAKAADVRQQRVEKERIAAEANARMAEATKIAAAQQPTTNLNPAEKKQERPSPATVAAPSGRHISLAAFWDTKMQGGSETLRDLNRLFARHAQPSADLNVSQELIMADGIPYLCPLQVAEMRLNVGGKISTKSLIAGPGFPRDSISYHSYDGHFEDRFNRMYIVTDAADQLLSVELVDETPRQEPSMPWDNSWFCYNFVNYRVKAAPRLQIAHTVEEVRHDVFRVDSALRDPGLNGQRNWHQRTLEISRWYVPRPFIQLILYCVSQAGVR